jgi:Tetratricopeptide repeat./FRG domain.
MLIEKYLKQLEKETEGMKYPIFRGQVDTYDESGNLNPVRSSAARRLYSTLKHGKINKDYLKQSRFIEYHNDLLNKARNNGYDKIAINNKDLFDLDLLAQIQHFGGATCLVDFTENFLVALYFATTPRNNMQIKIGKDNVKTLFSNGRIYIVDASPDDGRLGFITQDIIRNKSLEQILKNEIGQEYTYNPNSRRKFWIWKPDRVSNRIISQDSIFFFGLSRFENKKNNDILYKQFVIKEKDKSKLRYELSRFFNLNAESIFSDLQGFSGEANNSRIKASIFEKPNDCLTTAKTLMKTEKFDLALSYLEHSMNCYSIKKSCVRNVTNCIKDEKHGDNYESKLDYLIGNCYQQKNQYDKALAFYREAFAIDSNIEACRGLIEIYFQLKNYDAAFKYTSNILARDKNALFDILVLTIYRNDQDSFNKYSNEIKNDSSLKKGMGAILLSYFILLNQVINNDGWNNYSYSESLKSIKRIKSKSLNIYWLFDDVIIWLNDLLKFYENRTVDKEDKSKCDKIRNLLLLTGRLEDIQKGLINQYYEKTEY